jgi:hypothetical protein
MITRILYELHELMENTVINSCNVHFVIRVIK